MKTKIGQIRVADEYPISAVERYMDNIMFVHEGETYLTTVEPDMQHNNEHCKIAEQLFGKGTEENIETIAAFFFKLNQELGLDYQINKVIRIRDKKLLFPTEITAQIREAIFAALGGKRTHHSIQ